MCFFLFQRIEVANRIAFGNVAGNGDTPSGRQQGLDQGRLAGGRVPYQGDIANIFGTVSHKANSLAGQRVKIMLNQ